MKNLFVFIALLIFLNINAKSANYCQYQSLRIQEIPILTTDMNYETLIGYIAFDSLIYHSNDDDLEDILSGPTLNDTMKTIMKYYYNMMDYNPVLFHQSMSFYDSLVHVPGCRIINTYVQDAIEKNAEQLTLDKSLLRAAYIFHIAVLDTIIKYDTTSMGAGKQIINVSATILDTIKGRYFPKINPNDSNIEFSYSPYWTRTMSDGKKKKLRYDSGDEWIAPGNEYIVFLEIGSLGKDSTHFNYTIRPVGPWSGTFLMYPVINNLIFDPADDFKFGPCAPGEFKIKLRNRITEIKKY